MEENLENNVEGLKESNEENPVVVKPHRGWHILLDVVLFFLFTAAVLFFLFSVPVYIAPALQSVWGINKSGCKPDPSLLKDKSVKKQIAKLDSDIGTMQKKLNGAVPVQPYLVVNTVDNYFYLYNGKGEMIRTGRCSTGKNTILTNSEGKVIDKFKTPRGCFSIQGKREDPIWTRPDWDYIEQGLPVPPPGDPSRYEKGVLGDYAMTLGHGYMIHGTIYKRFLGLPVTHGCIRLNDDDLVVVYKNMKFGSKVFIY